MDIINKKNIIILFFIFYSLNFQGIFAEGLRFFGNGYPIDKRTSYNVFSEHPVTFSSHYKLRFDLYLYLTSGIGNIVRIKTENEKRIFNLFYDGYGNDHLFLLNEEGKSNLIRITLDKSAYPPLQWLTTTIDFDLAGDAITLTIADKTTKTGNISLLDKSTPVIVFGRSDHIIDVPAFAIKDLSVGNSKKYRFMLNEYQGDMVHDIRGKKIGSAVNPDWLINDSYHWKPEAQFSSATVSGTNYHEGRKELYYFNHDSILILNLRTGGSERVIFSEPCPVDLRLGTNFIDQENDRLYCYEIYHHGTYQDPTVASLDLHTYEWRIESYNQLPTQLHHHGSWFDSSSRQYMIFGGFGNMHFSNQFYRYNPEIREWSIFPVDNKGGITPRYFTSLGFDVSGRQLYLFGGTGNVSGDQSLGREYFYDLYRLDLQTNVVTKVWEIPWYQENVVPVRGMIINDKSFFYTLCYPEHFTESFLKLYRFSLEDGDYTILGDSIPIYSDKINTNANLYYDKDLNTLYAVVHQFEDDIKSDLHIYSLAFPPITEKELSNYPPTGKKSDAWIIYLIMGTILLGVGVVLFRQGRRRRKDSPIFDRGSTFKLTNKPKTLPRANSICLFGEFTVCNRDNRNITYLFSKKLKETFCLLLQYSQEKEGITSQHLSRLLWPEKPLHEVKNIRNVTLNRLRKILEELDGIELLYEKGMFTITHKDTVYCDYTRCMQILSANQGEAAYKELIDIVIRGKFLEDEDSPFYDSLKEKTEKRIEPLIIRAMEESYEKEAYQTTVDLAQAVFHIDPMNEAALTCMIKAMQKMGMHEGAKIKYLSFLIEYKKIMGKDYPNPMKL
ncbi:DNA-binding transcriptional activator [uncultured Proteiniphilum sp.]|uniref:Kelch repeat-containing protein n=1 Tax=uncultured Proteiniphilum sp. TaxID=497637 RepID=UPI00261AF3C7|nr:DNA-binding transcriptional activator [uncultured Proteiniphilum sp.]